MGAQGLAVCRGSTRVARSTQKTRRSAPRCRRGARPPHGSAPRCRQRGRATTSWPDLPPVPLTAETRRERTPRGPAPCESVAHYGRASGIVGDTRRGTRSGWVGRSAPCTEAMAVALVGSMSCVPGRRTARGRALTTRGHRAVRLPSSTKAGRVRPLGSAGLTCPVEPERTLRARRGPLLIQNDSSRGRPPHRRRRPFWLGASAYPSSLPSHEAVRALS